MTNTVAPTKVDPGPGIRTFLFADIRGYTRFIVEHGDAAGVRLVERFGEVARQSIPPAHGEIIGLVGDEAVAVFESAREALHAALEFQRRAAEATATDPTTPILVGIGLDTGEAVPAGGNYVGAALNLAARLCKLAGPKEVLASEGVTHVARKLDGIGYAERGYAQLKGFRDPVRVFKIVNERETPAAAPATDRLVNGDALAEAGPPIGGFLGALPSTELVARDAELRRALADADAVVAGAGRLIMVTGEPGVGKTRLAQEIMLSLRNRRFVIATGRCYQLHQSVPFYPFLDALMNAFRSASPVVRAAVSERWPYLCRLLPELKNEGPRVTASTAEEQQLLFREVTAFLEAIAKESPVAVMLDDLHWADGATLELLQHLARHTRADRILLVGTYRDVEVGRHHPLEAALRDLMREDLVERIGLHRLEPDGTAKLIASTLGEADVSPELDSVVHQHADGNPFFTQQLVRYLVERGDVYRQDGRWVERSLLRVEVPESVRSVIGQRTERLTPDTQQLLREAAVLGQTFAFPLLVKLTGRTDAEVERDLEEARATGLIEERHADQFAFDHALTQQTLYGELSPRRRRSLHVAAGEALERLPPEERDPLSAELAWHFLEAAQEDRAIPYALVAGDRARAVFANGEAERQYTTVLEIAEHTKNREGQVAALSRRARLYLDTWRGKPALSDGERLLEQAHQRGDRKLELRARLDIAQASYIVALDEQARDLASTCREMYETAAKLADELGDERSKVEALLGTRWFGDFFPEYRVRLREHLKEALEISRRIGDEELVLASELANWAYGSRADSAVRGVRLLEQLRERRDLHRLNLHYFSMMWFYLDGADFRRAVEACDAGIRLASEIGVPPVQYPTLKALALLELGEYRGAWESLHHEVTDRDHPFGQAMQTLGLGTYYMELAAYGRAVETFRDLRDRANRLRRAWMMSWAFEGIARALARAGKIDTALWEGFQKELVEVGSKVSETVRAEVLLSLGDAPTALSAASTAVAEAQADERIQDLLDAQEVRVRCLLAAGRPQEAAELAEKIVRDLEASGAEGRLWRMLSWDSRARAELHDEPGARAARERAESIASRIGATIPDPELKRGFFASPAVVSLRERTERTAR